MPLARVNEVAVSSPAFFPLSNAVRLPISAHHLRQTLSFEFFW